MYPTAADVDNVTMLNLQNLSMVEVDPEGAACAARKRAVFHAMGLKTRQRSPAFPPVLTSYKPLEIERVVQGTSMS